MLTRRDALRAALLMAVAGSGLSALTGCGESAESGGGGAGIGLAASDVRRSPGNSDALPDVVAGVQAFTGDLYRLAAAGTRDNLVLSPYSVAVALAMTRAGAAGRTASEMDSVLHAPPGDRLHGGMNELSARLESRSRSHELPEGGKAEVALSVASSLWGQHDLAWEQEFLDTLAREYGAGMRLVDYVADAERARELVNEWTAEHTRDKITELVPEGVFDALTRLALVNAIHFKAPWLEPFEDERNGARFTLGDGEQVEVDLVTQLLMQAEYAEGSGWVAARMPYVGGELAMALVVPEDLGAVEEGLDAAWLGELLGGFARAEGGVRVTMPRWDFRSRLSVREALSELGMPTAFDPEAADFTKMTPDERLHISHVLHEATITVDEKGTEAAAATAVVMGVTSAPVEPPREVTADRPFLFVVHDVATATPLFIGRVADPR
ncbi:MAG: serpin family protein [Actinomycetota bacterium]